MAHKKGAGSTKNGRDSNGQRLGVKVYGKRNASLPRRPRAAFKRTPTTNRRTRIVE